MPNNNPSKAARLRMPDFKGSWWKYRESNTTTLPIGKWVPVLCKEIPGKSLFKVRPQFRFESLPMVSPLYNGFTMRTKFYFVPVRLYIPELRRNKQLAWGAVPDLELPRIYFRSQFTNSSTSTSLNFNISLAGSLFDRLGIAYGEMLTMQSFNNPDYVNREDGVTTPAKEYVTSANLLPFLAYLDCWLYGEYNPQDKYIPYTTDNIRLSNGDISRTVALDYVQYETLRNFVDSFAFGYEIRGGMVSSAQVGPRLTVDVSGDKPLLVGFDVFTTFGRVGANTFQNSLGSHWSSLQNITSTVGLLPLTYKGGYFTSWYSEEGIQILKNYVVSQGESLLSLRRKNADFLVDALALVSGNRYTDYLQYIFDSNLELKDHPIMVGFDEIDFGSIDVVSQSQTGDGENGVLAAAASKARNYNSTVKPFSFKTLEPGVLMCCTGIIPNEVYYQGTPRFMNKRNFADLWHPQYDAKGFQTIAQSEYYNPYSSAFAEANNDDFDDSPISYRFESGLTWNVAVSYVPLGWEYMQSYDTISGGMKTSRYSTWNLRRDYRVSDSMTDSADFDSSVFELSNPLSLVDVVTPSHLRSTYVSGYLYNYPFENVFGLDNDNIVCKFSFDCSTYMPMTHQLITKTI